MTPAEVVIAINGYHDRERAAYWRAGLITAMVYNVNRPRGRRAARPSDFIPQAERRQTPEQMAAMLKAFTLALGGTVVQS